MFCLVALCLLSTALSVPAHFEFNMWKQTHGKVYQADTEETARLAIFIDNLKFIEEYNNMVDTTMTLGVNEYADMTHEEFKAMMTGSVDQTNENFEHVLEEGSTYIEPANYEAPSSVDWRRKGAVTPVKNQGQCGSCYAFSSTGSIEGQWFRKSGHLVSLSEQQIVDCSTAYGNHGCKGGSKNKSFTYIKNAGGVDTEKSYPYEGVESHCRFRSSYVGAKVTGFKNVQGESSLQSAVASVGPISVSIDASHKSLQFYKWGIYYDPACSSTKLGHAVLAVGYGSDGGKNYWIVKNSWGARWGMKGYFNLRKDYNNHCGIATKASYPLV